MSNRSRLPDWSELLPLSIDRDAPIPIFQQIYLELRRLILAGTIPARSKLPPTRKLAEWLTVSRTSVMAVYEQLLAEGLATGRTGAGTFVATDLPESVDRGRRDRPAMEHLPTRRLPAAAERYAALRPEASQFSTMPFNTGRCAFDGSSFKVLRKLWIDRLGDPDPLLLGYNDPQGSAELRRVVAQYLRAARAIECDPDQVLILPGTQHAIDLVLKILIEPGDAVWMEDPGYPWMQAALRLAGAKIVPVPVDDNGLDVAAGMAAGPGAKLAYVTPSNQYPLGVVLSTARRVQLLSWAREVGSWIIEDDYDSEFRYASRPLASLQGLDRDQRVIYLGTLSKALFPGLRLSYAVVPPALVPAMTTARFLTDRQPAGLTEAVISSFISQGHFSAHLNRMRKRYRESRDALVEALLDRLGSDVSVSAPDQGLFLLVKLKGGLSDIDVTLAARRVNIVTRAVSGLAIQAPPVNALMLGFSGHSPPVLRQAVDALAEIIERKFQE